MFKPLLERIRPEVSGERALEALREVAGFHRIQASPGYDAAAAWLIEALTRAGLEPEVEWVAGDGRTRYLGCQMPEGWDCSRAAAWSLEDGRREPLCAYPDQSLSIVQRSDPAHGRFRLIALADGTEAEHYAGLDVRGAIVLTGGSVHRVHRLAVVERGAAGLLSDGRRLVPPVRTAEHDRDSLAYTSFWWGGEEPRGWGFVVSPNTGAALRARLTAGARIEIEVEIESRRFPTRIPLVTARLPGERETLRDILVTSHLCHPRPSANDNASGVAAALETARTLAALQARGELRLRRGIRFLWMPEFTGTFAWIGSDPARASRIAAAVNLDMVGQDQDQCGSTLLLEHPPCFMGSFAEELLLRIRDAAQEWVTSYSGPGHFSLTRMAEVPYSGGSDHAVWIDPAIGVPCPMLIQWPDRYYHSSYDTPDRSDPRSLAHAARSAAAYAAYLAECGPDELLALLVLTGRGARRRLLAALDREDPVRATLAERMRGERALASVGRLAEGDPELERAFRTLLPTALDELVGFWEAEIDPAVRGRVRRVPGFADARVPRRRLAAPLDMQRHLLPGWGSLAAEAREAFRRLESAIPGGQTTLDAAWYACDGRRDLGEIAELVRAESGQECGPALADWFERLAALALVEWVPAS